jgi:hypothetical protein
MAAALARSAPGRTREQKVAVLRRARIKREGAFDQDRGHPVGRWEPACKPGSVEDSHSSGTHVAVRLKRPTRGHARATRCGTRLLAPLFGLAPGGVYPAADVAIGAVRSYRTFSPLPLAVPADPRRRGRRCIFCGTFRGLAPPRHYLAPCPMEPGLSSPHVGGATVRPTPRANLTRSGQAPSPRGRGARGARCICTCTHCRAAGSAGSMGARRERRPMPADWPVCIKVESVEAASLRTARQCHPGGKWGSHGPDQGSRSSSSSIALW